MKTLDGFSENTQLIELLELLSVHCSILGVDNPKIQIIMPKIALDNFNKSFVPHEKVILTGNPPSTHKKPVIKTIHTSGGMVELFSDEEAEILKK